MGTAISTDEPLIGALLIVAGRAWHLDSRIGCGSMSTVFHAAGHGRAPRRGCSDGLTAARTPPTTDTPAMPPEVAVKLLKSNEMANAAALERFERETVLMCNLDHAGLIRGFARGTFEGRPFVVGEYVPGTPLDGLIARKGALEMGAALTVVRDILETLAYLFAGGWVRAHRDIKPGNIMVMPSGHAKLIDLGVARSDVKVHTELETHFLGSLHYIAPEQIDDAASVDIRADLYSLGAVFFEMCTGYRAFAGKRRHEVLAAHLEGRTAGLPETMLTAVPVGTYDICTEILQMTLAPDPIERFQTPSEFLEVVERGLALCI